MNLEPFHQVSGDIVVGLKHKGSVSQKLRLTATYNAGSSPTEFTIPIPIHEDESEEEGVWDVLGGFVGYTVYCSRYSDFA